MKRKIWGQTMSLDLQGCNKRILKNKVELAKFPVLLCKKIRMKPYGKPILKRFGSGYLEGYSFMQFIETSSITGHMDEVDGRVFIDIFSCKTFNVNKAKKFCQQYFQAKKLCAKNYIRG